MGEFLFKGLIEETGVITSLEPGPEGSGVCALVIEANRVLSRLEIGDQIAVNGVCLTVVDVSDHFFIVRLWPRTQCKTNLSSLQPGDKVNLERNRRHEMED